MRHLEGPKNPDGLNLSIRIFVHVYKVHMCMFFNIFFLPKKKSKRCERKPPIISNLNS